MCLGLSAPDKTGKLEIIERHTSTLLVWVFSRDLLTIAEMWNSASSGAALHNESKTD